MKEAITKAIEGGYERNGSKFQADWYMAEHYEIYRVLLDPLFWQALSNAIGRTTNTAYCAVCGIDRDFNGKGTVLQWHHLWHRFIDHLAEGGTPDDFFYHLLN